MSLEKARKIVEEVEQEWPSGSRFTPADLAEMWDYGFLSIDILDPIFAPERCHIKGCKYLEVYHIAWTMSCFQHSLEGLAECGNAGFDPDPFSGGPYIPIAERTKDNYDASKAFLPL